MTYTRKFSGDHTAPILCTYTCPVHGEFDATVERDENGEAPDVMACPADECWVCGAIGCETCSRVTFAPCGRPATWTPSPVAGRVRRVEVTRGKWEKPERKTYLDTRNLGEGQPLEELQAERRKIWRDERMDKARKEFLAK